MLYLLAYYLPGVSLTDVAPYLARARIEIVPEPIGSGFKLGFFDYIIARVPAATAS